MEPSALRVGGAEPEPAAIQDAPAARRQSFLSAIVCPLTPFEIDTALANLELWERDYPPFREGQEARQRPELVFSFSGAHSPEIERRFVAAFEALPRVKAGFSSLKVHFCDLAPEKDLYIRNPIGRPPKYGFKSGPNWQFYETMRALKDGGGFAFLMETDCRPLAPGWVAGVCDVARQHRDAWIVGAHYSGMSPLHWSLARHINGNALYHVGDDDFWAFMDGFFWEWMHGYIRTVDPNLAYDCAWEAFINRPELEDMHHEHWRVIRRVLHKFQLSEFIVNVGGRAEQAGYYVWNRRDLRARAPSAVVVHGPVGREDGEPSDSVGVGKVHLVGEASWTAGGPVLSGVADPVSSFERSVWLRGGPIEEGDQISLRIVKAGGGEDFLTLNVRDADNRPFGVKKFFGDEDEKFAPTRNFTCKASRSTPYLRVKVKFRGVEPFTVSQLKVSIARNGKTICDKRSLLDAFAF